MFLAEQNSIPITETKLLYSEKNFIEKNNFNENDEEINDDIYDLNLIILHRSLFILKKKFEKYKKEINDIYMKYKENEIENNNEILVEQNKVRNILEEISNASKFGINKYNGNFKEIIFDEMNFYEKIKLDEDVINDFNDFLMQFRRKYNHIFIEKKNNKNFRLEDYVDYVPEGDDELTKVVMETENSLDKNKITKDEKNKDNISELITNKFMDSEQENFNGEMIENEKKEENEKNEEKENEEKEGNEESDEKEEKEEKEENEEKEEKKETDNNNINENNNNDHVKLIGKKKIIKKASFYSEDESPKKVQFSKSYLYIESLPLIIADFLSNKNTQNNSSYIITEHSDDLKNELRTLFDNEILGRLGEEVIYEVSKQKIETLKDLLLNKSKLERNIKCYEDLLYNMRTHNKNVDYVLITLNKLKKTLKWVEDKINNLQNDNNTFNEFENAIEIKKINRDMKKYKKYKIEINGLNNGINIKNNNKIKYTDNTNLNNNITMDSTKKEKFNENNSELSDISILKLDNKIEGMDTERLIDLNIIDNSNNEENYFFMKKNDNINNKLNKKKILPKLKIKNNLTKEEKRNINLKEIFNFYSHLHTNAGHKLTFDSIREKFDHMNLNEFLKFCAEFKILIQKEKLIQIFLKKSELTKEMSFIEFQVTLNELSRAINQEKINQLKKKIKQYKKNNNNVSMEELIKKCNNEIIILKQKTNEELLEEFYEYLEIDDTDKYRKKMKGYELPIFYSNLFNNYNMKVNIKLNDEEKNKKMPIKLNSARQMYIKEVIEKRKQEKKNFEKNLIRVNGLEREYQKKNLDINNNLRTKKKVLNPINNNKFFKKNKMISIYENIFDKSNENDRYKVNSDIEEAKRDILKKLNLKMLNENKNENVNENFNEALWNIRNNKKSEKENNKFTWDNLTNMKSNNLVDENELNNLIN